MLEAYDEAHVRSACRVLKGFEPHDFQIQAAKSLHQRKDTCLIAPTGKGKSLAILLPFFAKNVSKNAMVIVVTPLKALQKDQTKG